MGAEAWLEKGLAVASRPRRNRRNKDVHVAGTVDTVETSQIEIIHLEEVADADQQTQLQDENAQLKVEVDVLRQEVEMLQIFQEIETIREHEVEASKHEIEAYEKAKHVLLCGDALGGAHSPYNGLDTSLSISRVSNESCDY